MLCCLGYSSWLFIYIYYGRFGWGFASFRFDLGNRTKSRASIGFWPIRQHLDGWPTVVLIVKRRLAFEIRQLARLAVTAFQDRPSELDQIER